MRLVFFLLLCIIVGMQINIYNKILDIDVILQENLLPPLPEWEEQQN